VARGDEEEGARVSKTRIVVIASIAVLVAAFVVLDIGRYLNLETFQAQRAALEAYYREKPVQSAFLFLLFYVAVTGLSLPGATSMTVVAGAMFGLVWGTVIVSFASSIGATLAFLASRFLFRDAVQRRFGARLAAINAGVERDGAYYLFTLRLVPVFAFVAINLLMGLTPLRTRTFYWVSQLGMLPGTVVYVNAGTQLSQIESLRGILSPGLLLSFALLGLFPLAAKKALDIMNRRKVYARWSRPGRFDRNLIVIGAGSAGLVAAYLGAALKAKTTLVEKNRMGGDCLNTGCVPSKALIRSAKLLSHVKRSREWGIRSASAEFDFAEVMERVQRVIRTVEPHDSVARYTKLGVECIEGEAKIVSPWSVEVKNATGTRTLTTRSIVIAAGARPFVPPIPGIEEVGYVTSDTLWELRRLPARLVVLGGGPIGSELAQCFARFGSRVTVVEMLPRLLIREDPEVSELVARRFREEGIDVRVNTKAKAFGLENGEKTLVAECGGQELKMRFDLLLCAVGRVANTTGYGLEELGISVGRQRTVDTNEYLQTIYPNIYLRRRGRSLPVHAHGVSSGLVCGCQRPVRTLPPVQGRLLGDSLGDVHRPGGGARGSERDRGERERDPVRSHHLRHGRSRPRHRGRRARRAGQGPDRAGQGPDTRGHHRRRSCRRPADRVHRGDEARHRAEPYPLHHPRLSDARGGQPPRGGQLEARPRPAGAVALAGAVSRLAAPLASAMAVRVVLLSMHTSTTGTREADT
jgi:uncharacterized membrane protein YdjX (TVP38/TMEM64 family)/thioredoxin reductase